MALPAGTGDEVYLEQLSLALAQIEIVFQPDLVFYLAGADPFVDDRLGLISLSKMGLRKRDEVVFRFCEQRDLPIAIAMAGGYAPKLEDIVDIHETTIRTAKAILYPSAWKDDSP